jgi:1-acyl-sn-glycerol-3-phosphate acyltransferase
MHRLPPHAQVLFMMPIIGWSMRYSMGGVPLDRGNRDKAVRSLHKLESSVLHWKRYNALPTHAVDCWGLKLC